MKIETSTETPSIGMTLTELRKFLQLADNAGMAPDAIIKARIRMGGAVKSIAAEGSSAGGTIDWRESLQPPRPRQAPGSPSHDHRLTDPPTGGTITGM